MVYSCTILHLRSPGSRYFLNSFRQEHATLNILYHYEARQMPETIQQEALQLEPVLGSFKFLWRSHLTTTL